MFSPGRIYSGLFLFFGLGAVVPVIFYLAARRWPKSPIKFLMAPLIFGGSGNIPPATPLNYLSWGVVGYAFQRRIKDRFPGWWARLNYLTSSGLDLGLALGTLFIFFALLGSACVVVIVFLVAVVPAVILVVVGVAKANQTGVQFFALR